MDANPSHNHTQAGPETDGGAALAREERRARRLAVLDAIIEMNLAAAERLTEYIRGQLTPADGEPFARMPDPCLALERLTRAVGGAVALQERIDEDAETRAERLKAEQAARREAERSARQSRAAETAQAAVDAKKLGIRRAVGEALLAAKPGYNPFDCERILDNWFKLYETYDGYDGDPAEIAAKMCAQHNIPFDPALWAEEETETVAAETPPAALPHEEEATWSGDIPEYGAFRKLSEAARRANGHDPPGARN